MNCQKLFIVRWDILFVLQSQVVIQNTIRHNTRWTVLCTTVLWINIKLITSRINEIQFVKLKILRLVFPSASRPNLLTTSTTTWESTSLCFYILLLRTEESLVKYIYFADCSWRNQNRNLIINMVRKMYELSTRIKNIWKRVDKECLILEIVNN